MIVLGCPTQSNSNETDRNGPEQKTDTGTAERQEKATTRMLNNPLKRCTTIKQLFLVILQVFIQRSRYFRKI